MRKHLTVTKRLGGIPWAALVAGFISAICLLLVVTNLRATQTLTRANCTHVEQIDARIRFVIQAGAKSLGKPGGAGYSYYRAHPAELAAQRRQTAQSLYEFRPRSCKF